MTADTSRRETTVLVTLHLNVATRVSPLIRLQALGMEPSAMMPDMATAAHSASVSQADRHAWMLVVGPAVLDMPMVTPAVSFQKVYDPEARAFALVVLVAVVSPVTTALKATTSPLQEGGDGQGSSAWGMSVESCGDMCSSNWIVNGVWPQVHWFSYEPLSSTSSKQSEPLKQQSQTSTSISITHFDDGLAAFLKHSLLS